MVTAGVVGVKRTMLDAQDCLRALSLGRVASGAFNAKLTRPGVPEAVILLQSAVSWLQRKG